MGMTYKEILDIIKEEFDNDVSEFAYCDNWTNEKYGRVEEVDNGGGEDRGSDWYSVKHFVDQDVYIKVSGYYSSYDGTNFYGEWECCKEVRPQQVTITVYK